MADIFAPIPKVNATADPAWAAGYWNVLCWNHDDPTDRKAYTIRAASDNEAAQEGIRRFLAEAATDKGSVNVRSHGAEPEPPPGPAGG